MRRLTNRARFERLSARFERVFGAAGLLTKKASQVTGFGRKIVSGEIAFSGHPGPPLGGRHPQPRRAHARSHPHAHAPAHTHTRARGTGIWNTSSLSRARGGINSKDKRGHNASADTSNASALALDTSARTFALCAIPRARRWHGTCIRARTSAGRRNTRQRAQ